MKKLAAAFMGALVLAGCGSVRYPTTYILNLPPPIVQQAPSNDALGTVATRELQCPEYLCEGRIVYRSTPEELGFYEYHRWAMSPRQAITQYLEDSLRAQSLFKSVVGYEHGSDAVYLLTGSIERLEEVDQGSDVRVVCTISAQLLDTRTRSVLWRHTASETVQVEKHDIRGVVNSFSTAARTAADRLLKSMTEEVPEHLARTRTERGIGQQPSTRTEADRFTQEKR